MNANLAFIENQFSKEWQTKKEIILPLYVRYDFRPSDRAYLIGVQRKTIMSKQNQALQNNQMACSILMQRRLLMPNYTEVR